MPYSLRPNQQRPIMTATSEQRTPALAARGMASFEDKHRFALNFAPHLGIVPGGEGLFARCAGPDVIDQINFSGDNGFVAIEDNFFSSRPVSVQKQIGRALASNKMQMGCQLGVRALDRPTFGLDPPQIQDYLKSEIRYAIAAAERVEGRLLTIIPGRECPNLSRQQQIQNVARNLKELAPMAEAAGVTLVVEAISRKRWQDILVADVKEAYAICQAVDSPEVGLLFDVYQCQCESGDIISNMEFCWDQIRCMQIADNPGRMEPGTGEINFFNVFAYLKQRNWSGLVEMEHGLSRPGAQAGHDLIKSYQALSDSVSGLSQKDPWDQCKKHQSG